MDLTLQNFTPAEQATFRLRALYEQGGYRKYRASGLKSTPVSGVPALSAGPAGHHLYRPGRQTAGH